MKTEILEKTIGKIWDLTHSSIDYTFPFSEGITLDDLQSHCERIQSIVFDISQLADDAQHACRLIDNFKSE